MLTALENGVKGGKWFSLIDKVYAEWPLTRAATIVSSKEGCAGVDHVTIDAFFERKRENLEHLSRTLQDGTYRPQSVKRTWIPKPGSREKRPLWGLKETMTIEIEKIAARLTSLYAMGLLGRKKPN